MRLARAQRGNQSVIGHDLAFCDRAHGIDDARRHAGLAQVAAGARLEDIEQNVFRRIQRQHQDTRRRVVLHDPARCFYAIHAGQAQVHDHDVGLQPPRLFDGHRSPGFKAHMQLKDLNIILDTAQEYDIPILGTVENTKLFQEMIEMGMGELDNSAVVGVIEQKAGVGILDS